MLVPIPLTRGGTEAQTRPRRVIAACAVRFGAMGLMGAPRAGWGARWVKCWSQNPSRGGNPSTNAVPSCRRVCLAVVFVVVVGDGRVPLLAEASG